MSLDLSVSLLCLMSLVFNPAQVSRPSDREHRIAVQCPWNGQTFSLRDTGDTFVGEFGDITIRGSFVESVDKVGAYFSFSRGLKVFLRKSVPDLTDPNGWISISNDQKWFAINSSNGGAAGGWTISIVHVQQDGTIRDLSDAVTSVMKDFSSRHNCATRGDNYESLRWIAEDQLLLTAAVYGTSDCGSDIGYLEGYVLQPSTGKILKRYSKTALLHLPENCTYNLPRQSD